MPVPKKPNTTRCENAKYPNHNKSIRAKNVTAIAGTNTPTFNVTALPAGTYYISLNDGTNIATTKFVKQ